MKRLLKLGTLMHFIGGALITIPTWLYGTFIFHTLYVWFGQDITGIDLTYMQCMGILVLVKYLKHPSGLTEFDIREILEKKLPSSQVYAKLIGQYYVAPSFVLLIGWIIKQYM